jgi:hypothetical protein
MDALTRRSFFRLGLAMSTGVAATAALSSCGGSKPQAAASIACASPDALSPSEMSLRQSNHYVEKSADAAKHCAGCNFFTAGTAAAGCGTCQIYNGGPANPQGYCDSWAAKA